MMSLVRNFALLTAVFVAVILIISAQSSPIHVHSHTATHLTSSIKAKLPAIDAPTHDEASLREPCDNQFDAGCDPTGGTTCPLGCGVLNSSEHVLATLTRLGTSPSISHRLDSTPDGAHFRPPISLS